MKQNMDLIKKESVSKEDDTIEKCCLECKSTKTPLWRIGPAGPRTLCNACGIRYAKIMKKKTAADTKNKKPKPKASSPTKPSTTTKSAVVPSVSSSTKLGNMQRRLEWGLNYSPLRPQNGRYRLRNSPSSTTITTTTTTTTTTVVKNSDTANIRKSLKIGLRAFGEEVVLLQRQRSSTLRRKRRINEEEEEAAALLIALSNCGSVLV